MDAQPSLDQPHACDRDYYRAGLRELFAMSLDIARVLHQQITTPPEPPPAEAPNDAPSPPPRADAVLRFDRIGRSLRQTALLACTLEQPLTPRPAKDLPDLAPDRITARRRIIRGVEDRIHENVPGPRGESLQIELLARLDAPEMEAELLTRPIPDLTHELCRDLGVFHDRGVSRFKRRTPKDIATLHAQAARPTSAAPHPPWTDDS